MLMSAWEEYAHVFRKEDATDLYTEPIAGSGMRMRTIRESGIYRLSRRTCNAYSILIEGIGAWGRIILFDGRATEFFHQPSTFTGSFVLDGCAFDGLYCHSYSGPGSDAIVTVNWREMDLSVV
jgi:hypothetical protein